MPHVIVQTIEGILDNDQKKRLLERVADVMVEVEGRGDPAFRKGVWVRIEEQPASHWFLGGAIYTSDMIAQKFGALDSSGNRK